jgi:hypothetical protein
VKGEYTTAKTHTRGRQTRSWHGIQPAEDGAFGQHAIGAKIAEDMSANGCADQSGLIDRILTIVAVRIPRYWAITLGE